MDSRFTSGADWFAARRGALSRSGQWLAGDEPGRPDPADFEKAKLRILICRLSPYDDVLPSITHRLLLAAAQAVPGVYADLAFLPNEADAEILRRDGVPPWLATGCKRAPAEFDVLAVSLSVQQEAANLPAALQLSGLKLDFASRLAAEKHPLILLGGHGAASVPFIHGDAAGSGSGGLVDAVCLGDGLTWLQEFARRRLAGHPAAQPKKDFLLALARELPGTYVPAFYRHEYANGSLTAIVPAESGLPFPAGFRQDPMESWLAGYDGAYIPFSAEETEETLPLAAGCIYRCRFCQTGWMRREFSSAKTRELVAAATRFKAAMVNADLNLLASDACSISGLDGTLEALAPLFRNISVKSLSVSSLVRRPEYFQLLRRLAKHEFTFGVEGISARLRAWLGKPATVQDLIQIVAALAGGGLRQLKLFFIATGLEDESDFAELESLLRQIHVKIPAARVIASFMPLFHAPFTPLQYAPVRGLSAEAEKILSALVRQAGGEFRWSAYPDEIALMNRLCRAGRAATPALVDFALRRGLRYTSRLAPDLVRELAAALPDDPAEKRRETVFPWSDLQASADQTTLWRSYEKACTELQAAPEPAVVATRLPLRASAAAAPQPVESSGRAYFWIQTAPAQAQHPDHVVVRAFFRRLFASWKAGPAAYLGNPVLLRPPGTCGWALASAEFKAGARWPAKNILPERASLPGIRQEDLLFEITWPGLAAAGAILNVLKQSRVKFQTVRRGASRWQVVERAFRGRTGLVALREDADQTTAWCSSQAASLKTVLAASTGEVTAVLQPAAATCPACKGVCYEPVAGAGDAPACFTCLTQPRRG